MTVTCKLFILLLQLSNNRLTSSLTSGASPIQAIYIRIQVLIYIWVSHQPVSSESFISNSLQLSLRSPFSDDCTVLLADFGRNEAISRGICEVRTISKSLTTDIMKNMTWSSTSSKNFSSSWVTSYKRNITTRIYNWLLSILTSKLSSHIADMSVAITLDLLNNIICLVDASI